MFIEWTAAQAEINTAAMMVDVQGVSKIGSKMER